MAKTSTRSQPPRPSTETLSPVEVARAGADAMFRAAIECCHQHDRVSRILAKSSVNEEIQAVRRLCALCDETLQTLAEAYERNAVRPQRADDSWWHCANTLWLASHEYTRRNTSCEEANKEFKEHGRERLGELHTEYELEASALLGLRHAAEAYGKCRPVAT